jgi:LuxR family maltose regulon positive regulatory protein
VAPILLQTKLYDPPVRHSLVLHPQLIAKLAEKRPCMLILLSGPAGYGKTTLITEWIEHINNETPVCWLSVDEDDNDPQLFFG